MTPEELDLLMKTRAEMHSLFWTQIALLALLGTLLIVKIILYRGIVNLFNVDLAMLREIKLQHRMTDSIDRRVESSASTIREAVDKVPEKVVAAVAESSTASVPDGQMVRPSLT